MSHRYHKLYNETFTKMYIACPLSCSVCKEWSKPNNIWKCFEFFPYHCINCEHAGYPEEFYLFNDRAFMCLSCYTKANKEFKKLLFHNNKKLILNFNKHI